MNIEQGITNEEVNDEVVANASGFRLLQAFRPNYCPAGTTVFGGLIDKKGMLNDK